MPAPYKRHGISTQTVDKFFVDAGAVYINLGLEDERLLGATRGGNSFVIEQEVYEPEIDGSPGALKGSRRIVEVRPRLTTNLIELSAENIKMALAGADMAAYPDESAATHDVITRNRNIINSDYLKNIALVGTISGSDEPIIIIVKDALQDENFEIGTENRGESVVSLQFTGHFDPANMGEEPWEIRYPRNNGLQSGNLT